VNASLAEELLSLSEDDLEDLETVLVGAAPEFEEAAPRVLRLASGMDKVRASYYRRFEKLTADLERKAITLRQFEKEAHDLISTTFRDVYRTHRGRTLTPGDEEWLSRASAEELRYASKFGKDIDAGNLKMPRQRRAMLYAQTLNGIALNAKIEALPDNSRIWWRLGRGEHCIDCLILAANSPYTKWNLPTTPRSGDTRCVSNCLCKLEVNLGVLSRAEREDAAEYAQKRDQSLNDMLRPVKPPRGMRLAEPPAAAEDGGARPGSEGASEAGSGEEQDQREADRLSGGAGHLRRPGLECRRRAGRAPCRAQGGPGAVSARDRRPEPLSGREAAPHRDARPVREGGRGAVLRRGYLGDK